MRGLIGLLLALLVVGPVLGAEAVTGSASYRERIALPPGAVFEAVLEDVSLVDAPAIEVGRTSLPDPGNPPFAFKIAVDAAEIRPSHTYSVRAQISVGRKLIFTSDKMNPVLTNGAPSDVQVWMIKVGDTAQEATAAPAQIGAHGLMLPASFAGDLPCDDCEAVRYRLNLWPDQVFHMRRAWSGEDVSQDTIGRWSVDPDRRVLSLRSNEAMTDFAILGPGRIRLLPPAGQSGEDAARFELTAAPEFRDFEPHLPLRGMLTYDAEQARFTECLTGRDYPLAEDGDYLALEHAYLAAGAEAAGPIMASFDGAILEASGDEEPQILVERFVGVWPGETCERAVDVASLTNTYWKFLRLGDVEVTAGQGRREPNLMLRQGAPRFVATVGCNQFSGSFALSGDALAFSEAAQTRMACQPPLGAWEAQLASVLGQTASYRIDGQTLELINAGGQSLALLQAVYLY